MFLCLFVCLAVCLFVWWFGVVHGGVHNNRRATLFVCLFVWQCSLFTVVFIIMGGCLPMDGLDGLPACFSPIRLRSAKRKNNCKNFPEIDCLPLAKANHISLGKNVDKKGEIIAL